MRGCSGSSGENINRHTYSTGHQPAPVRFLGSDRPCHVCQFALPYLTREVARQDGNEYHLDGPDAIRHLDALCSIRALGVVQWVAGAARQGEDWSDLYRRIDRLGKGQILGGGAAGLERWRRELSAGRLFWNLTASSRAEAEDVIARCSGL